MIDGQSSYGYMDDNKTFKHEKFTDADNYIAAKLNMLDRDFGIRPTEKELQRLTEVTTEIAIDNVFHQIFINHLTR